MSDTTKKVAYIGVFAFAMTLIGNVIGVGFSTGREVMTYFGNFGKAGIGGIFLSFGLCCLFAPIAYSTARNMDKYSFDWVITPLGWKPLRIFNLIFTLVGLSSSISAMIAGAGSILNALFNVPYLLASSLVALLCLLTVVMSLKRFSDLMGLMVPVMVVLAISICLVCAISPVTTEGGWDVVSSDNKLIGVWWTSALVYFGVNVGPIIQLVTPMSKSIRDKKTARLGALVCALALIAVAVCAMLAIVFNYPICFDQDLPTVTMGFYKAPIAGILYGAVALMAIYSTCTAFLFIFKSAFESMPVLKKDDKRIIMALVILVAACFGVSFIGYANFVDKVWAVLGYFGYIGIAGIIFNYFYYKKHPQNRETAVDHPELAPTADGAEKES